MDKNFFKNHKQIVYLSTVLSIILYLFTYYLRIIYVIRMLFIYGDSIKSALMQADHASFELFIVSKRICNTVISQSQILPTVN